ncbi:lanthionine synthetase C family protein [Priestia filamentosa]|uniref:lanthionine synthetase C family protein n=1 Tax=Priestia filamentosa TaxID=1402861 RepID=UPI000E754F10|nr:lanthionine synthetase C family protein [Priestia filamentosa]MDT3766265.1 lanthionine synthetase C family protein [Priestia filamentosa]RJS63076.1 hypothetical protein CJ485_23000 [Priestia filamentosa]
MLVREELISNTENIIQSVTTNLLEDLGTPEALSEFIMSNSKELHLSSDYTLASGISGLILLISQLQKKNDLWEEYSHRCMTLLNKYISEGKVNNLSLWGGLTGIAASTYLLSNRGENYSNFLSQLNNLILENIPFYLNQLRSNLVKLETTSLDFETIYGLSGITRYLLLFKDNLNVKKIIPDLLSYFIGLNEEVEYKESKVPRYFITQSNQLNNDAENYPGGHIDLGLSHGICGPLSVLALALENGFKQPGQVKVINNMVKFLLEWSQQDQYGIWWPGKVNFNEFINKTSLSLESRSTYGWCYGTPGVARVLWICGRVLNNKKYQEVALNAYKAMYKRGVKELEINTPTFCHGLSGLLHLTHLMHIESNDDELLRFKEDIIRNLIPYFDKENPLGFYDVTFDGNKILSIGALDGMSGILTVLNSINTKNEPEWSFIFLTN